MAKRNNSTTEHMKFARMWFLLGAAGALEIADTYDKDDPATVLEATREISEHFRTIWAQYASGGEGN